ncbi:hypothetical protein AB1Y20_005958 [Prymnesium parvum]|uniref:Uncharacterized protein n=1 Tax=Prymnesium parvum TaxID=97485 RepID=A0AB34J368_PRYPA
MAAVTEGEGGAGAERILRRAASKRVWARARRSPTPAATRTTSSSTSGERAPAAHSTSITPRMAAGREGGSHTDAHSTAEQLVPSRRLAASPKCVWMKPASPALVCVLAAGGLGKGGGQRGRRRGSGIEGHVS